MAKRYDGIAIPKAEITPEGYLKCFDTVLSRTGVFNYRNADGTIRRELRHPDDVFNTESLNTLKLLPLTLEHPSEKDSPSRFVNADNSQKLQVGSLGENIIIEDGNIKSNFIITRNDAVYAVKEKNKKQLSLAYEHDKVKESGEYMGMPYDYRQTNIKYNHLAIVDKARAGNIASINLDSEDAILIIDEETKIKKEVQNMSELKTINLDGVGYEADIAVINALKEAEKNLDSVNVELATEKENSIKLQANFDSQKDKIEQLEKELSESKNFDSDEIKRLVNDRVNLISTAKEILPEEGQTNLDEMDDLEIKKAIIIERFPKANLDEKDETYINARFDSALEVEVKKVDTTKKVFGDAKKVNLDSRLPSEIAYERQCNELYNRKEA